MKKLISLTLVFYLAVFALINTYLIYKLLIKELDIGHFLFFFIIFSLIMIIIFLGKKSLKFREIIFISISSTFFTIFSFEIYLMVSPKIELKKKIKIFENQYGKDFDLRSKIEVLEDVKSNNPNKKVNIVISPQYIGLVDYNINLIPLSGISNSISILCNELGYYSIYNSDRYGFNNNNRVWDEEIDYVLIGDSFTHGACHKPEDQLGHLMIKKTNKDMLNLGYMANGPLFTLASLIEYKPKKAKKIIYFWYEGNDLKDLNNELKIPLLKKYLEDKKFKQNLKSKQDEINKIVNKFEIEQIEKKIDSEKRMANPLINLLKINAIRNMVSTIIYENNRTTFVKKSPPQMLFDNFEKILIREKEIANSLGAKIYFVYLPSYFRYSIKNFSDENRIKIKEIVERNNINFFDIDKEVFSKNNNPKVFFPYQKFGHYTPETNNLITDFILKETEN